VQRRYAPVELKPRSPSSFAFRPFSLRSFFFVLLFCTGETLGGHLASGNAQIHFLFFAALRCSLCFYFIFILYDFPGQIVEAFKRRTTVRAVMALVKEEAPLVYGALIAERDAYMARSNHRHNVNTPSLPARSLSTDRVPAQFIALGSP
jgi:hypothetical protein